MTTKGIKILKSICLYAAAITIILSNTVNYFYCYKYLDDRLLQWKVAMISIGFSMFAMSFYMWLSESLNRNKYNTIITGWIALFLLISFLGVCLGYNLHSKGFMMILFVALVFGGAHIFRKIWQK